MTDCHGHAAGSSAYTAHTRTCISIAITHSVFADFSGWLPRCDADELHCHYVDLPLMLFCYARGELRFIILYRPRLISFHLQARWIRRGHWGIMPVAQHDIIRESQYWVIPPRAFWWRHPLCIFSPPPLMVSMSYYTAEGRPLRNTASFDDLYFAYVPRRIYILFRRWSLADAYYALAASPSHDYAIESQKFYFKAMPRPLPQITEQRRTTGAPHISPHCDLYWCHKTHVATNAPLYKCLFPQPVTPSSAATHYLRQSRSNLFANTWSTTGRIVNVIADYTLLISEIWYWCIEKRRIIFNFWWGHGRH
jgi:hypothetical protein